MVVRTAKDYKGLRLTGEYFLYFFFCYVQDLELNETKRTEASLKEEKGDADLEIKTLKR